ncbi:MAG: tRNA U-34 5-methylaminomethyl-2-thiouridine biosynthesis protein [Bdellovibrionaceae bacterium]|nr:tRNA U-34 5-methylaminomethyl-2-thiouridine biosynthesis protein [Pseudobdellovibrionaceae bacterium]
MSGRIVAGLLAPHPPHLVYAENPPQNEPKAECGWENLRWAYERMRHSLSNLEYDVLIVHSPHWRTQIGTHFLGVKNFKSKSVDPIFPHLFRYNYELEVDVDLAEAIEERARNKGLLTKMMKNPDFRVDYGTIVSCHMTDPTWSKPIVGISSVGASTYYSVDVMDDLMRALGEATREAVEASGKRAVLIASHSLSHRHFVDESDIPEDMSKEHIQNHSQYLWDMKMIELMKKGNSKAILDFLPDFTEQTIGETDAGGLAWMLNALGMPQTPAIVHGYGTVIGTGNAVAEWRV